MALQLDVRHRVDQGRPACGTLDRALGQLPRMHQLRSVGAAGLGEGIDGDRIIHVE